MGNYYEVFFFRGRIYHYQILGAVYMPSFPSPINIEVKLHYWSVWFKTANEDGAGTNATTLVRVLGHNNVLVPEDGPADLDNPGDDTERGDLDRYIIKRNNGILDLNGIKAFFLYFDPKNGPSDHWLLDYVFVGSPAPQPAPLTATFFTGIKFQVGRFLTQKGWYQFRPPLDGGHALIIYHANHQDPAVLPALDAQGTDLTDSNFEAISITNGLVQ